MASNLAEHIVKDESDVDSIPSVDAHRKPQEKIEGGFTHIPDESDMNSSSNVDSVPSVDEYGKLQEKIEDSFVMEPPMKPAESKQTESRSRVEQHARKYVVLPKQTAEIDILQNYHVDCQAQVNVQIHLELSASLTYLAIASFFNDSNTCLPGFAKYFHACAEEEQKHAWELIKYHNMRGASVQFKSVDKPKFKGSADCREAVKFALRMEMELNGKLLELHALASEKKDSNLSDFIGGKFLTEQVESIKELSDLVSRMKRAGHEGAGIILLDQDMANKKTGYHNE